MSTIRREIRVTNQIAEALNQLMHRIAELHGPTAKGPAAAADVAVLAGLHSLGCVDLPGEFRTVSDYYRYICKELPTLKQLTDQQKYDINQNLTLYHRFLENYRDTVYFFVEVLSFLPDEQIVDLLVKATAASVNIPEYEKNSPKIFYGPLSSDMIRYIQTDPLGGFIKHGGWKESEIEALDPEQRRALDIATYLVGSLSFINRGPFLRQDAVGTKDKAKRFYGIHPRFFAASSYIVHECYERYFKRLFSLFKLY